ncbi:uncharacterized protein LOC111412579 [Olea europaea var. sylvestris]|uniref:uncharacterized protein LOC111412579 n=1 Tax=Olea europaea var. sylvestris TaxID=158386 RepID=UPI000C1D5F3B|nr:uncharacterized protein LOC111412579 [Olea europaea var. sylvestris]
MNDDLDEELHEEYINQVMRDETDFNELVLTTAATIVQHHNTFLVKEPCRDSSHTGMKFVMEILNGNDRRCQEMFRMEKHAFCKLCDRLRSYGLCSSKGVQLEGAVCMFLMTLGHGVGNRMIQERSNPKYWPYFKDCIGAIDGTHIHASLPTNEQIPYIGRKGYPTQNIMAVCSFDMLFTFVWPRWEGTTHDTHIFWEAL